jgi:hypothetical protein
MIIPFGTIPIYSGQVKNHEKHYELLEPYVTDDSFWHETQEWMSLTQSTMGQENNINLPWDIILGDIEEHVNEYLQIFHPTNRYAIQTRPWMNRYEKGGWQEQHNHTGPASHFSMAYIIKGRDQSNFVFSDTVGNWYDSSWELPAVFSNWPHRNFTPEQPDGTVLIFPSALDHFVMPNQSDEYRITASANYFIVPAEEENNEMARR